MFNRKESRLLWIWLAVAALALDLAITAFVLWRAYKRRRLVARLRQPFAEASQGSVPPRVRAYAEAAGAVVEAGKLIRIKQSCSLRFQPDQSWHELKAESLVAVQQPGFIWQGSIKAGPLPLVSVVDAFVCGKGLLDARLLSLLPLAQAEGEAADLAEAMRYLAELPWAPDAILQTPGLTWLEQADGGFTVEAQTASGPARVTLWLDENGGRVRAENRPRAVKGGAVPTPWEGRFWNPQRIGQRLLPSEAEVAWILPEGPFVYWKGRLLDYKIDF